MSLAPYLDPLRATVPPVLISARSMQDIVAVAGSIPAEFARNTFGFECRLGDPLPRADFLVQASRAGGQKNLAGLSAGDDAAWRAAQALGLAWGDDASLVRDIDKVWLEFDIAEGGDGIPPAGVFFGFSDALPPARGRHLAAAVARHLEVTIEALEVLGAPVGPDLAAAIGNHFHVRRGDLQVFQVGFLGGRGRDAVRLCLRARDPACIPEYLEAVARTADAAHVAALTERLARRSAYLCLDLDVGPDAPATIGLECYVAEPDRAHPPDAWGSVVDLLVELGCCRLDKAKALMDYPGESAPDDSWPEALLRIDELVGSRAEARCLRWVHHVKLVMRDGTLEAKAYLAVDYVWR